MQLRRLRLRAFRNYSRLDLAFEAGVTVFVGTNGQGKSNLLEAVYFVATGRSYRTAYEAELIRYGEEVARVSVVVSRRGRDEEMDATLAREAGRVETRMRVNGVVTPRGAVLGRLPVVVAAPWDLELVRGAGAGRRRLLDGALAQLSPAYFFALHRYHRVVIQRNAELRRAGGKPATGGRRERDSRDRRMPGGLEPWNAQLVEMGVRLTAHRRGYVVRLQPAAASWFRWLGGQGRLELCYRPSWSGDDERAIDGQARASLASLVADELRRGVTLSGPHRDDVELTLDGVPLRATGSQGQWRTAVLAIRLAEREVMAAELGVAPILLLDDVLAELDSERQGRVLALGGGQVLVTTTVLPAAARPQRVLRVTAGTVGEESWSPH